MFKTLITLAVATSLAFAGDLLLLDTSGSLSTPAVQSEIKDIAQHNLDKNQDVLGFSDNVYAVNTVEDVVFGGGTNLSAALSQANALNYDYVVLVTDGEPNNEMKTLHEANLLKENGVKICSVFISVDNRVPLVLAKISDEIFYTQDIKESLNLCSNAVRDRLLNAGCDLDKPVVKKEKPIKTETVGYKVKHCNATSTFPVTVRTVTVEVK